jgi:hypothetical protein
MTAAGGRSGSRSCRWAARRPPTQECLGRGFLPPRHSLRSWRSADPEALLQLTTPIVGPRGCFLFVSPVSYRDLAERPEDTGASGGDRDEYLLWGFSARRDHYGPGEPFAEVAARELRTLVGGMIVDWHPVLQRIVQESDPESTSWFAVKTSKRVEPWTTGNVTLLGDALHSMPPYRGVGANTALLDAALLRETIVGRDAEAPLVARLAEYERRMIDHGFRAVETSLAAMRRFHAESAFERLTTKGFFRAADFVPRFGP